MAKEIELDYGLVKEHEVLKGFFYPPFKTQPAIVVNEAGVVKDAVRLTDRNIKNTPKGYLITHIKVKAGGFNFPLHRLVALTFIARPERHKEIPFENLQVNHIDGDKLNNTKPNLEWVDGFENMRHARINGLFSNNKSVLTKNIKTGEINEYYSTSECARHHFIKFGTLNDHLRSPVAARIEVDGLLFKFNDGSEWPTLLSSLSGQDGIIEVRDIVAHNLETGVIYLTNTLKSACEFIGVDLIRMKNHRARKGIYVPCDGWLLCSLDQHEEFLKDYKNVVICS